MAIYESKIVEFEGQICIIIPDEIAREFNLLVDDTVNVEMKEGALYITPLKKK